MFCCPHRFWRLIDSQNLELHSLRPAPWRFLAEPLLAYIDTLEVYDAAPKPLEAPGWRKLEGGGGKEASDSKTRCIVLFFFSPTRLLICKCCHGIFFFLRIRARSKKKREKKSRSRPAVCVCWELRGEGGEGEWAPSNPVSLLAAAAAKHYGRGEGEEEGKPPVLLLLLLFDPPRSVSAP